MISIESFAESVCSICGHEGVSGRRSGENRGVCAHCADPVFCLIGQTQRQTVLQKEQVAGAEAEENDWVAIQAVD